MASMHHIVVLANDTNECSEGGFHTTIVSSIAEHLNLQW